jgi:hypothetical protein
MSDWQLHCQAQRYECIDGDSSCHSLLAWENLEIEIGDHHTTLDYYTEMKNINKGTLYHAHPHYHNGRPWQDWAMVSFGTNSPGMLKQVPLRLLIFYEHQSMDALGNVTNDFVQTCDYQIGTAKHR